MSPDIKHKLVQQAQREMDEHQRFLDSAGEPVGFASEIVHSQIEGRIADLRDELRSLA